MRDQILDLVTRHCASLRREGAEIASLVPAPGLEPGPDRAALVERLHKLKGGSGSIGFQEISQTAETMEARLREAGADPLDPSGREGVLALHARLQDLIARIAPEQSTLYARFL